MKDGMETYIGTKIIGGMPMTQEQACLYLERPCSTERHSADSPGYLVEYKDGYQSWSPEKAFEDAYRKCNEMSFGLAIEAMKKGEKVARAGWNGKGMCVYFVEGTHVLKDDLRGNCAKVVAWSGSGDESRIQSICGHIDMLAADGSIVVGWLASQTDMLSNDWQIV